MKMHIKNIILSACLAAASVTALVAQPMRATRPEYSLKIAEESKAANDYYTALVWYEKYYEATKDRAVAYEIAQLQLQLRDYVKAETWFSRVMQRDKKATGEVNPETLFYYAQVLKMNEKYDESILNFEDFLRDAKDSVKLILAKTEIEGARMAMKMKENTTLIVENAGSKINSPNNEYSPSVTPDGSTIYFTGFKSDKIITLDGKEGDYYAKVMKSSRNPRGLWAEPESVGGDINRNSANQGNVFVTTDGKVMYFTRIELNGNEVSKSTLFYATKQGEDWSPSKEVAGVNGNYIIKHPCVGEIYGKEVLFFSSNMESTVGGYDIFYANKTDDGTFGTPTNAGATINTVGDEETPYYRDGKLYFSSTGHPGIGGFDVFTSNWNGSTWTKPENMGKGINSSANDRYLNVDDDGSFYMVSNRPGGRSLKSKTCCEDIYILKKEPIKINLVATTTSLSKKPLSGVTYRFVEIIGGKPSPPDEQTGDSYRADLLAKKAYMIISSKPGYYSDTTEFNTVGITTTAAIEKKIVLKPLPIVSASLRATALNGTTPLSNVNFQLIETGSKKADVKTVDVYSSVLGINKIYLLVASKQGFTSDTVNFNTNDIKETTEIEKVLNLRPKTIIVKKNERIKIENLYYKLDKSAATEEEMDNFGLAQKSLDYVFDILTKYPDMTIELGSHTDAQGSDKYNLELSQKRATGVKKYLIAKGIDATRMAAKGYGETRLVNQCKNGVKCTDEEHKQNRRTEFRILSGPTTIEITEQQSATNN